MTEDPLVNRYHPPILPGVYTDRKKLSMLGEYLAKEF